MKTLSPSKFDLKTVLDATVVNKAHVLNAEDLLADRHNGERESLGVCRCCFYLRGFQGQTVGTAVPCAACGTAMRFGSSKVNLVCLKCSKDHRVCVRCLGDLNDNARRARLRADG